ncbi:MAG: 3-methyl-2-oxobutanoate dehydrogenase subunit beta, partial [Mogibacterium sp.]|nr:3-methyl-2-oxobutanoate dehydrogenase subunit beta [Mogibacterium sp.]
QEACDLTQLAFDIADRYRTPVIVLGDATIAQSMEPVTIRTVEPAPTDKSWAATGWSDKTRPCAKLTSIQRNEADLGVMVDRLQACYRQIKANHEERFATYRLEDAEYVIAAFGTVGRIALSAVDLLREQGIRAGLFRPVTLWPFPEQQLYELAANGTTKEILVAEMNAGQMVYDVELAVRRAVPVSLYNDRCTFLPLPSAIAARVRQLAESHQ